METLDLRKNAKDKETPTEVMECDGVWAPDPDSGSYFENLTKLNYGSLVWQYYIGQSNTSNQHTLFRSKK